LPLAMLSWSKGVTKWKFCYDVVGRNFEISLHRFNLLRRGVVTAECQVVDPELEFGIWNLGSLVLRSSGVWY